MDAKVVEFTALLRQNGVRVSLAETMDAFRALDAGRPRRPRDGPRRAARHRW